jgi:hypothetical protein
MKKLSENWLTENLIDLEYKQYILLAYLEDVEQHFKQQLLYPSLAELISHYRKLKSLRDGTKQLYQSFPGELSGLDFERFKLSYRSVVENDQLMDELERIISFSLPKLEIQLNIGKSVYEKIENQLKLEPIGLVPLRQNEGYMILKINQPSEIRVYEYAVSIFEDNEEKFRAIHTKEIAKYSSTLVNTAPEIKADLIRNNKEIPNPATYFFSCTLNIPVEETYLPIAKRMLIKELSHSSGNLTAI